MNKLNQFKNALLNALESAGYNEEVIFEVEDIINGNLKETSSFTMVFDQVNCLNELESLDKHIKNLAVECLN
jgi:hypothetical protein